MSRVGAPPVYGSRDVLPTRQWLPVWSSNLARVMFIPHDPRIQSANQLFIEFHNQSIYVYYNVPRQVWLDLMAASSKGRFHWRKIRDKYAYRKLS